MKNRTSAELSWTIGFVLIFIMVVSYGRAQSDALTSSTIDGHSFLTVAVENGTPSFPPIKRKLTVDPQYATLQLGDTLGTLFVCCGKDTAGQWLFYLLHHGPDQMWHLTRLDLGQNVADTLRTTFDLTMHNGRETPFPVDLRLSLSKRVMFFRWALSSDYPDVPGGKPTPADVEVDLGKTIFPFTATALSGGPVRSTDFAGRITVINWWSTWCSGCKLEIDGFNKLVTEYQPRVDFVAIAVNSPAEVKTFLAEHPFTFRQAVTTDSIYQHIGSSLPHTLILNREGVITFDAIGGGPDSYLAVKKGIEAALTGK
jgi:thiol-disulfide isomerase/thioredoxin